MKKFAISLFTLLLLVASVTANASPDQDAKVLVEKAVQIFSEKGKDYALKVVGASAGPLRKEGGLYVFAFSFDGTGLAHPVSPKLVSQQWDLQDSKGKYIIRDFVQVAKDQGAGWSEYWWTKPGDTTLLLKKTYIMRIPGQDILVGCGYYQE